MKPLLAATLAGCRQPLSVTVTTGLSPGPKSAYFDLTPRPYRLRRITKVDNERNIRGLLHNGMQDRGTFSPSFPSHVRPLTREIGPDRLHCPTNRTRSWSLHQSHQDLLLGCRWNGVCNLRQGHSLFRSDRPSHFLIQDINVTGSSAGLQHPRKNRERHASDPEQLQPRALDGSVHFDRCTAAYRGGMSQVSYRFSKATQ